jgi:hypothetical protein
MISLNRQQSEQMITLAMIEKATACSVWDKGNKVLYDMCSKYPSHKEDDEIIAKIWLIGRSYAAAIERRKQQSEHSGDAYYIEHVAPMIRTSKIDQLLEPLKNYKEIADHNFEEILAIHFYVTDLFNRISGLDKRSLASKYLHFHHPMLFFIYDSRAYSGIRKYSSIIGRGIQATDVLADNEYRKFSVKCLALRSYIREQFGEDLKPREIDNLLLLGTNDLTTP